MRPFKCFRCCRDDPTVDVKRADNLLFGCALVDANGMRLIMYAPSESRIARFTQAARVER